MAVKTVTCNRCNDKITNHLVYRYNGQSFCYNCYQEIQKDLVATEDELQSLYQYIKQLFSLQELSNDIINAISKEAAKGKKYKGMRLTLHYYYEVLGHPKGSPDIIPFIIRDQYDNARDYEIEVAEVKKINEGKDLSNPPSRKITLTKQDLSRDIHKRKKYEITDL